VTLTDSVELRSLNAVGNGGGVRFLWAAGQPEHRHLMELEQLVADEAVDEVGGHQPAPPVQRLAVEEAVLVHEAPHQQVVAGVDVQLGLGVVVGRLREWVVRVPAKCVPGVRKRFAGNGARAFTWP
jgi:hypothetical protein